MRRLFPSKVAAASAIHIRDSKTPDNPYFLTFAAK